MASNDSNGTGASTPVKLSFGMTKGPAKKPPVMSKPSAFGSATDDKPVGPQDELIKGFEGNKVESLVKKEEKGPLVIPLEENVDWRQQALAKRKKLYMPEGSLNKPVQVTETLTTEIQYGLQLSKRPRKESPSDQDGVDAPVEEKTIVSEVEVVMEAKEETLEEQAIRKLELGALGRSTTGSQPELMLGRQENIRGDDLDAFQKDLDHLPDEATLDDYDRVPVEEFGAALLRGMGWKGTEKGSSPVLYHQRPALLGLGAKPKEPEPVTKKYIKPGESRQPAPVRVPDRSSSRSSPLAAPANPRDEKEERRPGTQDRYSERSKEREQDRRQDRDRGRDRDRDRDRDRGRDRSRERYRDQGHQRDRDRDRDHDRQSERSDRNRSERDYRDRDRYRGSDRYDRDRESDRHRERDRERSGHDSVRDRR
ncbi:hypothetical protein DFQ27_001043 [Actinomortierella ambigua]|uniref:Spp2/MOS2 G-patch domain-containing protein n=1 Tax=Actinomortierella ambigua TaxID=1343610 RepID=A0A9P6QBA2_9FUNG|nr:hypothetical protein DFQ27_001043 [Actinomortierella ambigua]